MLTSSGLWDCFCLLLFLWQFYLFLTVLQSQCFTVAKQRWTQHMAKQKQYSPASYTAQHFPAFLGISSEKTLSLWPKSSGGYGQVIKLWKIRHHCPDLWKSCNQWVGSQHVAVSGLELVKLPAERLDYTGVGHQTQPHHHFSPEMMLRA